MTKFEIVELQAEPYAHITRTAPMTGVGPAIAAGFAELGKAFAAAGAVPAGPPLAHYLSYDQTSTTFELGFPIASGDGARLKAAGLEIGQTQAGTVMKATHLGPYDSLPPIYAAMQDEMRSQNLAPASHMWEIYMSPPETPPAEIRTEVIWPVITLG